MEKRVKQPLLQKAMVFAAMKHEGYVRKGTTIPYFTHVMEAMEIVSRITEDERIRAAAVLHDTLEDTPTTKEELIHFFGKRVANLVAAESEDKRKERPEGVYDLPRGGRRSRRGRARRQGRKAAGGKTGVTGK